MCSKAVEQIDCAVLIHSQHHHGLGALPQPLSLKICSIRHFSTKHMNMIIYLFCFSLTIYTFLLANWKQSVNDSIRKSTDNLQYF